jgi:hypothetical protein
VSTIRGYKSTITQPKSCDLRGPGPRGRARRAPARALPATRSALRGGLQAPGAVGRGRFVSSAGGAVLDAVSVSGTWDRSALVPALSRDRSRLQRLERSQVCSASLRASRSMLHRARDTPPTASNPCRARRPAQRPPRRSRPAQLRGRRCHGVGLWGGVHAGVASVTSA